MPCTPGNKPPDFRCRLQKSCDPSAESRHRLWGALKHFTVAFTLVLGWSTKVQYKSRPMLVLRLVETSPVSAMILGVCGVFPIACMVTLLPHYPATDLTCMIVDVRLRQQGTTTVRCHLHSESSTTHISAHLVRSPIPCLSNFEPAA